jgi:hypothetical protein
MTNNRVRTALKFVKLAEKRIQKLPPMGTIIHESIMWRHTIWKCDDCRELELKRLRVEWVKEELLQMLNEAEKEDE